MPTYVRYHCTLPRWHFENCQTSPRHHPHPTGIANHHISFTCHRPRSYLQSQWMWRPGFGICPAQFERSGNTGTPHAFQSVFEIGFLATLFCLAGCCGAPAWTPRSSSTPVWSPRSFFGCSLSSCRDSRSKSEAVGSCYLAFRPTWTGKPAFDWSLLYCDRRSNRTCSCRFCYGWIWLTTCSHHCCSQHRTSNRCNTSCCSITSSLSSYEAREAGRPSHFVSSLWLMIAEQGILCLMTAELRQLCVLLWWLEHHHIFPRLEHHHFFPVVILALVFALFELLLVSQIWCAALFQREKLFILLSIC